MSAGEGPLAVPSWAIGVMFTFFLIVALIWAKLLHATEGWLSRHNKPALKRVLHSLKEEMLAVGLIVLILPLFQNHLMRICIPESWAIEASGYTNHGWNWVADYTPAAAPTPRSWASSPQPAVPPAAPGYLEAAAPGAPTPASADHGAPPPADYAATSPSDHAPIATGRKLLSEPAAAPAADHGQPADGGGAGQSDTANDHGETKVEPGVCDDGWTQLFPADALHGIHIFIALTALVHVFYAGVCLTCCMLRMRFWWPWELEALQSPVVSADKRIVKAVGKSRFLHILMSIANTFILPINRKMYLSMRRLFLEGLQGQGQLLKLEMDFPYHAYVKESMELALCDIITVGPLVWLFAIIQLIIPVTARIYGTIGLCCMAIILMLAASAKLHSIVVHLVTRSNILYGDTSFSSDTQPDDPELGGGGGVGRPNDQNPSGSPIAADAAAKVGPETPTGDLWGKFQGVKDAMHFWGWSGTGRRCEGNLSTTQTSAPALRKRDQLRASVLQTFKTYAVRAKADPDSFPSMFWFNWPVLLLKMFKIAYFQAAFCLTLVLFALWKDNQFLPEQKMTAAIVTFFVLLAINIAMSFFTSASVLPVYALVNVTDKTAFAMAAEFAARAVRHQESMERKRRPTAEPELAQHEHQAAMEVLQRLQSHVGKMRQLIDGVQPFNATTQDGDGVAVSRTTSTADAVVPPSVVQCPEGSSALTPAAAVLVWQSSLRSSMVSSPRNRGADLWGSVRTAPWLDE